MPKKKKKVTLGVSDSKLSGSISEQIEGIKCPSTGVVPEILRGIRVHFAYLAKDLPHHSLAKAQLSLGHSYSRGKVGDFFNGQDREKFEKWVANQKLTESRAKTGIDRDRKTNKNLRGQANFAL